MGARGRLRFAEAAAGWKRPFPAAANCTREHGAPKAVRVARRVLAALRPAGNFPRQSEKSEWNRGNRRLRPFVAGGGFYAAVFWYRKGGTGVFRTVKEDIRSIRERDPAARSSWEVLLLYSGLHAVLFYRAAHWLYRHRRFILARWLSQYGKFRTGIEIHPGAKIGKGLFIDHGMGVVIGETAELGDNCTLYQGVTLGGTGKDKGKRHPTLGNNVLVGAGAKVLGPLHIGDNAKVGANALVLGNVPANATAVGVPARVVRVNGQRVEPGKTDLDQVHMPDPVSQELCRMAMRIDELQRELDAAFAAAVRSRAAEK